MSGQLLRVEDLSTSYATRAGVVRAVDGVSFSLAAARTLAIVGETGCGKSQTALSIMGLVDPPGQIHPDSRVLFGGKDLTRLAPRELEDIRGSEVSMIFQDPMTSLNPVHTIGQQIAETFRRHRASSRREANERAVEMLDLVGITSPRARSRAYPHQLSGGMRQRVLIAIALVCQPRLLIADEPTTALDATIQAQILDLLRSLRERFHMAMLLITHDLGVVAEMADEVAVMYAGRIVEHGPADDLLETPQHPYTTSLLRSIPVLGTTQNQALPTIPGAVPSPLAWPPGCRFAPRCQHAFDRCLVEEPPTFDTGHQGVGAACWLRAPDGDSRSSPARAAR